MTGGATWSLVENVLRNTVSNVELNSSDGLGIYSLKYDSDLDLEHNCGAHPPSDYCVL